MDKAVIDRSVLLQMKAEMRKDIRLAILNKTEVKQLLGVGETVLVNLLKHRDCKLIRSKTQQGKFSFRSVVKEFERIHGLPYKEAVLEE